MMRSGRTRLLTLWMVVLLLGLPSAALAEGGATYFVFAGEEAGEGGEEAVLPEDPDSPFDDANWAYPVSKAVLDDPLGLLVIVSDAFPAESDYPPQDETHTLVDATVKKTKREEMLVREPANEALVAMFAAAEKDGANLLLHSAYRSHYRQAVMYENRLEKNEGVDDGYVQPGGQSEHQTGLGFDIINKAWYGKSFNEEFATTKEAQWMLQHGAEYGFILRYPKAKEAVTGVHYEPWHLRYVGVEAAQYIMENGLTLEEFNEEWQGYVAHYQEGQELAAKRAEVTPPPEPDYDPEYDPENDPDAPKRKEDEAYETEEGGEDTPGMITIGGSRPKAEPKDEAPTDEKTEIIITAAGDITLGANMKENRSSTFYSRIVDAQDGDLSYFLRNVQDYFATDDLTLVNFEGTLTNATKPSDNEYCFRAPPEHVGVLTEGSVEAVSFENNHTGDFLEEGYQDTLKAFEDAGIVYSTEKHPAEYTVGDIRIALLSYLTIDNYDRLFSSVPQEIETAKANYDLVIVSFHWGYEKDFAPRENQIKMGRLAVDSGADLVLGHHSHRVNPIEEYNGKYIVYSLANCSFSGNTQPDNMDTFLFQQKFLLTEDGVQSGPFRIIPCSISSVTGESGKVSGDNDLAITPFEPGSEAAQRVIDRMLEEGKALEYAVDAYPVDWENQEVHDQ